MLVCLTSVKELIRLAKALWLAKYACNPLSNVVASLLNFNGVTVFRCVHLYTVSTVVAV